MEPGPRHMRSEGSEDEGLTPEASRLAGVGGSENITQGTRLALAEN